jgi:glycosyltransferase involved in cell wall biosynthesis
VIVGDGACRAELEGLARALGIADRVDFAGHSDAIPAHLARFDIFALSSDTEQMPIVVLEAMASGIPVVATDVGDIRLMVAEENAPFIGSATPDALAASLACLVDDPGLRLRLGAANRAKAERCFDQGTMLATWGALLAEPCAH